MEDLAAVWKERNKLPILEASVEFGKNLGRRKETTDSLEGFARKKKKSHVHTTEDNYSRHQSSQFAQFVVGGSRGV